MTTDVVFDAAHPVDDRYVPPARGEMDAIADVLADGRLSGGAPVVPIYVRALAGWFGVSGDRGQLRQLGAARDPCRSRCPRRR